MHGVLNLALLGLTVGSMYALLAVSFGFIFNVTHIFHLAHGAVITMAGYGFFMLAGQAHWPLILAIPGAMVIAAAAGILIEIGIYRALRKHSAPHVTLFLASVGILTVVEGGLGVLFGPGVVPLNFLPNHPVTLGAFTLSTSNVAMLFSWIFIAAILAFVIFAPSGRFMRAVGDNETVAQFAGIDIDKSYLLSFALGSALTVPGVIMYSWYQGLSPGMGLNTILVASAAVIIGGRHALLPGAIVALALGILQSVVIAVLPTSWQDAVVYGILLLVILARPQGLFGRRLRW